MGIKVSYNVILSLLMGMIKHSQNSESNKFALSLNYIKKEVGMEFIFCMQINIKVSLIWHYHYWWKWCTNMTSTQNRKLVIFLQYIKKNFFATPFMSYYDAKHSDIWWGSSHVCCYLMRRYLEINYIQKLFGFLIMLNSYYNLLTLIYVSVYA